MNEWIEEVKWTKSERAREKQQKFNLRYTDTKLKCAVIKLFVSALIYFILFHIIIAAANTTSWKQNTTTSRFEQ